MIVTELEKISADRFKVFIDCEFAFVLYKGELCHYHLAEGQIIQESDYKEITESLLPKRAKLRAMNLLQKKCYTERQLMDKLKEGFYSEKMIEDAVAYVKSFHYLDDLQYAVDYLTYYENKKSQRKLEADLRQRGIPEAVLHQAFLKWREQGGSQDEMQMIKELLRKKQYDPGCSEKEKHRIYTFLLRKGFSVDHVNSALSGTEF